MITYGAGNVVPSPQKFPTGVRAVRLQRPVCRGEYTDRVSDWILTCIQNTLSDGILIRTQRKYLGGYTQSPGVLTSHTTSQIPLTGILHPLNISHPTGYFQSVITRCKVTPWIHNTYPVSSRIPWFVHSTFVPLGNLRLTDCRFTNSWITSTLRSHRGSLWPEVIGER